MTKGSSPYASLIEAALGAELQRKTTADSKAASLVTTSGGLVAILAAVSAFVGSDRDSLVPWYAFPPLVLALAAFAFASLAGIMAGRPMKYDVTDIESLNRMIKDHWGDEEGAAHLAVAHNRVKMIAKLRDVNKKKGSWLYAGYGSQVVALVLLSIVVVIVLGTR